MVVLTQHLAALDNLMKLSDDVAVSVGLPRPAGIRYVCPSHGDWSLLLMRGFRRVQEWLNGLEDDE